MQKGWVTPIAPPCWMAGFQGLFATSNSNSHTLRPAFGFGPLLRSINREFSRINAVF